MLATRLNIAAGMEQHLINLTQIGEPPWPRSEMTDSIDEFCTIYSTRPIHHNDGGMLSPHMFAVWFMLRKLSPDLVVESGIWKGQGTWLIEAACPTARLISIDPNLARRVYTSRKAEYSNKDFSEHNWDNITERSIVFFDDHQNAYERLQQCKWAGFHHAIFDDNYPERRGDCYSLKKALSNAGFDPAERWPAWRRTLGAFLGTKKVPLLSGNNARTIAANDRDSRLIKKHLSLYYEFPPIFKADITRWGDAWDESVFPTPRPLLHKPAKSAHGILFDEAMSYTWICYVKFNYMN